MLHLQNTSGWQGRTNATNSGNTICGISNQNHSEIRTNDNVVFPAERLDPLIPEITSTCSERKLTPLRIKPQINQIFEFTRVNLIFSCAQQPVILCTTDLLYFFSAKRSLTSVNLPKGTRNKTSRFSDADYHSQRVLFFRGDTMFQMSRH